MSDYYPYSEFDAHGDDREWLNDGDELYEQMLDQLIEDFGSNRIDEHAAEMLYAGWFDADSTPFERTLDRFEFFDYTGLEWDDFDWDSWREWYES